MRLSLLTETLSQPLLDALLALGLVSDVDLLFASSSPTDIWRRLPPGIISLHEFKHCLQVVLSIAVSDQTWPDADRQDVANSRLSCHESLHELDDLLRHLACVGSVTEVSGDTDCGKSALALWVTCNLLADHPTATVLWVDTTGDFSAARANNVLSFCAGQATITALERLQVALAFDIEAAYDILDSITLDSSNTIQLIVIDAVTPLMRPNLSAVSSEGHANMAMFIRQLRSIAQTLNIRVLIINSSTTTPDGIPNSLSNFVSTTRKSALGPTFTYLVDGTLWLAKTDRHGQAEGDTVHVAEIFKSRTTQTKRRCLFGVRSGVLVGY